MTTTPTAIRTNGVDDIVCNDGFRDASTTERPADDALRRPSYRDRRPFFRSASRTFGVAAKTRVRNGDRGRAQPRLPPLAQKQTSETCLARSFDGYLAACFASRKSKRLKQRRARFFSPKLLILQSRRPSMNEPPKTQERVKNPTGCRQRHPASASSCASRPATALLGLSRAPRSGSLHASPTQS